MKQASTNTVNRNTKGAWAMPSAIWPAVSATVVVSMARSPLRLEVRMDDLAVAGQRHALHDLILPVDLEFLGPLVDQEGQEIEQVAGIERARVGGEAARHVGMADQLHAVLLHHLADFRERAIAALLHRQVDD